MSSALQELLRLPEKDRLEAINILWDSIEAGRACIELTDEERAELDRRLDEAERNPGLGISWEELRSRLTSGK